MQSTSATWASLWAAGNAHLETRITINGTTYTDEISAPVIRRSLMQDTLALGGVVSAACSFTIMTTNSIPKAASVLVEMRLNDGETQSEWLPAGTYYISKRSKEHTGRLALECYDALLKANAVWTPSSGSWPRSMATVTTELAGLLGLTVDSRTSITAYNLTEPEAGSTIRDALARIGASNGGSWIVTPDGKLRLVKLRDGATAAAAADATTVVGVVSGFEYDSTLTVSGIRYYTDGEPTVLGDETGAVIDIGNDATAVQDLYTALNGIGYQPYSLAGAIYDPAAELGDGLNAGANSEIASILCSETITLGPQVHADISAPPAGELADEYPYIGGAANKALIAAKAYANDVTNTLDTSLNQQSIFNRLTNNGAAQGLYMLNGQLYINLTYARAGTLILGGLNNTNGTLEVHDASDNIIGKWTKDGIELNSGKVIFPYGSTGTISINAPIVSGGPAQPLVLRIVDTNWQRRVALQSDGFRVNTYQDSSDAPDADKIIDWLQANSDGITLVKGPYGTHVRLDLQDSGGTGIHMTEQGIESPELTLGSPLGPLYGGTGANSVNGGRIALKAAADLNLSQMTTWAEIYNAITAHTPVFRGTVWATADAAKLLTNNKVSSTIKGTVVKWDATSADFMVSSGFGDYIYCWRITNISSSGCTVGTVYRYAGTAV